MEPRFLDLSARGLVTIPTELPHIPDRHVRSLNNSGRPFKREFFQCINTPDCTVLYRRVPEDSSYVVSSDRLLEPGDEGMTIVRNVGNYVPVDTEQRPRTFLPSATPL
jgi:hypothetical protein